MKTLKFLTIALAGIFMFVSCQKEYSMESGLTGSIASGTLQSFAGDCQPITTHGNFVKDTILNDSNYVIVQVNIATPGIYKIITDTVNGFSFYDSGYIGATGLQSFRLKASGTPIISQTTNFIVGFDTTFCTFSIVVTDSVIQPPVPVTSGDYFPTSTGSNWRYEDNITGDSTHVEVASTDEVFAGNTYRSFISNTPANGPGADTSFYRKDSSSYYQYGNLDEFPLYDTIIGKVEYLFLVDSLPVNSTWESPELDATVSSVPGKAKIRFTILGKDIQTNIGTSTIDSVIQVKRDYMFAPTATGVYQTIGSVDYYFAKNIGFIKGATTFPFPITVVATRWLIYY